MKKKRKMDKKSAVDDVQNVIDIWNTRFADLQKKKEAGQRVTNDDVKAIVLDVGADIYHKGVKPSVIDTSKKNTQLIQIMGKIQNQKFPLDSMIEHSGSKVKVNAIQLAAIKSEETGTKGEIIAEIVRDPDFLPLKVRQEEKPETIKPAAPALENPINNPMPPTGLVEERQEESIEEQSARSARNLIARLAPPEGFERPIAQTMPATAMMTAPEQRAADPMTDALFKGGFQNRRQPQPNSTGNGAAGAMDPANTDPMPAQMVQMPVQVVEPMEDTKKIPKDALGRIIR